jgi:AP2-like factor (euAP2 lineage)
MTKQLKVGNTFALVDDEDYDEANQFVWTLIEWRGKQYAKRKLNFKGRIITESLHYYLTGYDYTDHIDGDGLNNKRSNLREVTHKKNIQMQRPQKRTTSSAYRGVTWFKPRQKWRARLKVDGREVHVGYFDDEDEAAREWNKAALVHYGPDSFQNVIERKEVGQK